MYCNYQLSLTTIFPLKIFLCNTTGALWHHEGCALCVRHNGIQYCVPTKISRSTQIFFFFKNVSSLKITYWRHAHFLQARQPICVFYLKCHIVRHQHHVSRHKCAGNNCNRGENNNRAIVSWASQSYIWTFGFRAAGRTWAWFSAGRSCCCVTHLQHIRVISACSCALVSSLHAARLFCSKCYMVSSVILLSPVI